jgi:quercetin dioxygenase-like cupin family protein
MVVEHVAKSAIPNDRAAIERDGFAVAVSRFDPPAGPGGWHHHADHHVVAYVLAGTIRVETGPAGSDITRAAAGDLVYVEPGTVHRESYWEGQVAMVGFYFGSGPGRVDVDGPEGTEAG